MSVDGGVSRNVDELSKRSPMPLRLMSEAQVKKLPRFPTSTYAGFP